MVRFCLVSFIQVGTESYKFFLVGTINLVDFINLVDVTSFSNDNCRHNAPEVRVVKIERDET